MGEKSAHDPKQTNSLVKNSEGSVVALAGMTAYRTDSVIFMDDLTHDRRSRINSENIFCIQYN